MQPISIRTTQQKFIVSIDRQWVDGESFVRFIEKLKLKILAKDNTFEQTLEDIKPKKPRQASRYAAAQRFKSSVVSAYVASKYDVYEQ